MTNPSVGRAAPPGARNTQHTSLLVVTSIASATLQLQSNHVDLLPSFFACLMSLSLHAYHRWNCEGGCGLRIGVTSHRQPRGYRLVHWTAMPCKATMARHHDTSTSITRKGWHSSTPPAACATPSGFDEHRHASRYLGAPGERGVTDGIGIPDPNSINFVIWCL